MKKIPLSVKIIVPIMVIVMACGVFFGIKLAGTSKLFDKKTTEIEEIEAIVPDKTFSDISETKELGKYNNTKYEKDFYLLPYENRIATYEYEGIEFISFSSEWDKYDLKDLSEELFKNKHGDEIYELDAVAVYDDFEYVYPSVIQPKYSEINLDMSLFGLLPNDHQYTAFSEKKVISIFKGDQDNTIEKISYRLSHKYGVYFMTHYFYLFGDDITVQGDPYYKLRYDKSLYYKRHLFWNRGKDYYNYCLSYLIEVAADDYVYLMGSPNTKRTIDCKDTLDILRLSKKEKDDEIDEYNSTFSSNSLNKKPHLNITLPLPDQIDGLPELIFDTIGEKAPEYTDRSKEASEIIIKVKRKTSHGEPYHIATWNLPWKDEDVEYTLVAYDEDDYLIGGIKTINGTESAKAIFGGAVLNTSSHSWSWYSSDRWLQKGFLRLRVVATFSDGTAVVSPSVDWSFE